MVIDGVIASVESLGGVYILPELLRVRGECCAAMGDERQARSVLQRALTLTEAQSALSWRLRIAISLAERILVVGATHRRRLGPLEERLEGQL